MPTKRDGVQQLPLNIAEAPTSGVETRQSAPVRCLDVFSEERPEIAETGGLLGDWRPQVLAGKLTAGRGTLPSQVHTSEQGVYALWITNEAFETLDLHPGMGGVAYVGVGEGRGGLGRRYAEEWRPKNSGRSSPRRTLGALLIDELGLEPRPRPGREHPRNAKYYVFGDSGEQALTEWLDRHASFAHVEVPAEALEPERTVGDAEAALIKYLQPPLNIDQWANPASQRLKQMRRAAAEKAARWSPRHLQI